MGDAMWSLVLVGLVLTAGDATPLPVQGISSETGDSMLTWGDYKADCTHLVVAAETEPGVFVAEGDTCFVLGWVQDESVDCPEIPPVIPSRPTPVHRGCGTILTYKRR